MIWSLLLVTLSFAAEEPKLKPALEAVISHLSKSSANISEFTACLEAQGTKASQECQMAKTEPLSEKNDCILKQGFRREVLKKPYSVQEIRKNPKAILDFYDSMGEQQEKIQKLFKKVVACPEKGCKDKKLEALRTDSLKCLQ